MPAKSLTGSKKSPPESAGQCTHKDNVATTIHISRGTLQMLRDVALARDIADIAEASKSGRRAKKSVRNYTVASVIESLIEGHRAGLEIEAMQIYGRRERN